MVKKRQKPLQRRDSTRHFLFSKTDTKALNAKEIQPRESTWKELKHLFPDVLAGRRFLDQSKNRLDTFEEFCALAIKFDKMPPAQSGIEHYKAITGVLETFCKKHGAWWGILEHGLLAGFFPRQNAAQGLKLARNFQQLLKNQVKASVTIGIASYPTLDYPKTQVIENARKALVHATFFGPNSAQVFDSVSLNISGDQMYEKGNIGAAIEEFNDALKLDSANVNVRNSLGVCYGVQGNYTRANDEFKAAVELDAREYMATYNLGLVSMLNGKKEDALDFFLKAATTGENIYEIAFQTGRLYLEKGEPAMACKYLEQAAQSNPEAGGVYRYLGECYAGLDRIAAAIKAYKKALKFNPGDAASLSALGCLFDEQGENPEIAIMFCRESVGLSPENGLFRHRLGQLYLKQDQLEEALREFSEAQKLGYGNTKDIRKLKHQIKTRAS
jgi:tetratricopeptide (TPR) repeat protein